MACKAKLSCLGLWNASRNGFNNTLKPSCGAQGTTKLLFQVVHLLQPDGFMLGIHVTNTPVQLEHPFNVSIVVACVVGCVLAGSSADIATVEIDFGDGGHSYQAAPDHTYLEPGRVFTGFATVVDRRGQAVTQVSGDHCGQWHGKFMGGG